MSSCTQTVPTRKMAVRELAGSSTSMAPLYAPAELSDTFTPRVPRRPTTMGPQHSSIRLPSLVGITREPRPHLRSPPPPSLRPLLDLPRAALSLVLANITGHGDFAQYHERFGHDDAEAQCQCGRDKAPGHSSQQKTATRLLEGGGSSPVAHLKKKKEIEIWQGR